MVIGMAAKKTNRYANRQLRRRILSLALSMAIMASTVVLPAAATHETDLDNTETQIDELKQEQERAEAARAEAEAKKKQLEEDMAALQRDIDERQNQLDKLDALIIEKQDALDAAQMEFDDMILDYTSRIRTIEEYGTSSYWAIIFKATSLTDLLGRLDYVQELMRADEDALSIVDVQVTAMENRQEQLEELYNKRKYEADELKSAQHELELNIQEQADLIKQLDVRTSEQEKEIQRLEDRAKALRIIIAQDAVRISQSAEAIYQRYIVEPGYLQLYPEGCRAVRLALRWLGTAYVWGGESPEEGGFDCSGLVYYVYHTQMGYNMHRVGNPQYYYDGIFINRREDLHPGDLIYFENTYKEGLSHTAMYISDGIFVHAASEKSGIKVSSLDSEYYGSRFVGGKRITTGE